MKALTVSVNERRDNKMDLKVIKFSWFIVQACNT